MHCAFELGDFLSLVCPLCLNTILHAYSWLRFILWGWIQGSQLLGGLPMATVASWSWSRLMGQFGHLSLPFKQAGVLWVEPGSETLCSLRSWHAASVHQVFFFFLNEESESSEQHIASYTENKTEQLLRSLRKGKDQNGLKSPMMWPKRQWQHTEVKSPDSVARNGG